MVVLELKPKPPDVAVHRHHQSDTNGSERFDVGCTSVPRPPDPFPAIEYVSPFKRDFALQRIEEEVVYREGEKQNESDGESYYDAPSVARRCEAVNPRHHSEP